MAVAIRHDAQGCTADAVLGEGAGKMKSEPIADPPRDCKSGTQLDVGGQPMPREARDATGFCTPKLDLRFVQDCVIRESTDAVKWGLGRQCSTPLDRRESPPLAPMDRGHTARGKNALKRRGVNSRSGSK